MTEQFTVVHLGDESRYVLLDHAPEGEAAPAEIGQEQYLEFADGEPARIFYHTSVSPEYGGQGLASVLVQAAVDQAAAEGFLVVPVCPYVAKWFEKHPEYAEKALRARPEHLEAVRKHHS